MSIIFLSHSSKNDIVASEVELWLKSAGHDAVFVDHSVDDGIIGGQAWEQRLLTELKRCRALIALVSSDWLISPWCIAEINHASALGKSIIPILIENRKSNPEFAGLLKKSGPPMLSRINAIAWHEGEAAEQRLRKALTDAGLDDALEWQGIRSPYPGLSSFDIPDAPVFFGREQEITELLATFAECRAPGRARMVIIKGASGTGKSSLLRAGILPRLMRSPNWIVLPVLRPAQKPLSEIVSVFRSSLKESVANPPHGSDSMQWADWITAAAQCIREQLGRLEATVLLSVDQMEEAVDSKDGDGAAFLLALREALVRTDHRFLVAATLRADSIGIWERHTARRESTAAGSVLQVHDVTLGPVGRDSIFRIIQKPAELAGLKYDPGIVEQMVNETGKEDALPLLAYALEQLWIRYGKDDLRITTDEYDTFGGVEKSVGHSANLLFEAWKADLARGGATVAEIESKVKALRRLLLVELAEFYDDGRLVRRQMNVDNLPVELADIVKRLEAGRLLIRREETIEVAHDAFYRRWDQLNQWRKDAGTFLPVLADVRKEFAKNSDGFIPEGVLLDQAESLLEDNALRVDKVIRTYVEGSLQRAARRLRAFKYVRRFAYLGAVSATIYGILALIIGNFALEERDKAASREAVSMAMLSRNAVGDARLSAELAVDALPLSSVTVMEGLRSLNVSMFLEATISSFNPRNAEPAVVGALMDSIRLNQRHGPFLVGHDSSINHIAWSPDGKTLATASEDSTARLWDAATGREIAVLKGHESIVSHIAWSPDGKTLATASVDKTGRLWDAATGREIAVLKGHENSVNHIAWSPDGKTLATATWDKTGRLWEAATGREIAVLKGHENSVTHIAWSPDGKTLATASWDKTGRLWDAATGREIAVLKGHESIVYHIAWSPDGKTLATASNDSTGRLWEAATGREIAVLKGHEDIVLNIAWSPEGKTLATASNDSTGRLWEAATGREIAVFKGHENSVKNIAWSPDGKTLATASADDTGRLWEAATGREIAVLKGHENSVNHIAWSPDGKTLATASWDKTGRLWEAATGREIAVLKGHEDIVNHIAWSPDGKTLATASNDSTGRLWDAATGREIAVLKGHEGWVTHIAWSPDSKTLATASVDNTGRLWEAATGREIAVLKGHEDWVIHIAWSSDGKTLATASWDKTGRLWEAATGREIAVLKGHESIVTHIAWSPDGKTLATASNDSTGRLWEAATGRETAVFKGHENSVNHIAWSPDGKTLATASNDSTGRIWEAATGREIAVLKGHESLVNHIAWSPDGKTLATASEDSTARLWDAATGREIAVLKGHESIVSHIAWSPDGKTLATASVDKTGRLWDAATGREIAVLKGHENSVTHIAWSPDGKILATASDDFASRIFTAISRNENRLITCALGQIPTISESTKRLSWYANGKQARGRLAEALAQAPYTERWRLAKIACRELLEPETISPSPEAYLFQYQ